MHAGMGVAQCGHGQVLLIRSGKMKNSMMDKPTTGIKPHAARGFSLLELLIVMTVIAIVSTFAVVGLSRSRDSVNLQNSARIMASYAEKARLDAIRRHD